MFAGGLKKFLAETSLLVMGGFFAVFCCALQGIRKLVIVCFKASNNQTQRSLNVSSGLTVWGLKSCKG